MVKRKHRTAAQQPYSICETKRDGVWFGPVYWIWARMAHHQWWSNYFSEESGSCSDVMLSNKIVKKDENDALEKQSQSPDLNPTVHGRKKTMMFCTLDVANVAQSGVQDWSGERFSCSYERNWKQVFMLQDILHFSNKEFNPKLSGSKLAIGANVG